MTQASRERKRARRPRRELEENGHQDSGREEPDDRDERDDDDGGNAGGGGAVSELRGVMSEAAVAVLAPVAKKFVTNAAKMAVEKGPELIEDTVLPKLQDAGSKLGDLGGGLGDRLGGGDKEGKGGAGDGTGKGRRMPIQQSVDVAAPIETVYDQFTQFEDFPRFMHRVESVEQRDESHVVFTEKIWGVRRQWEAEIVEQQPDERIVWKTESGMNHVGVVTFHELGERLTRIELNLDLQPEGAIEKIARGARFAKRAARADLKRFKAFVEMRDEETGAWRGAIEEGEVVDEEAVDEEAVDEEAYEDEDEAEEEFEEPEASEDDDDEEEYEDQDDDEEDDEHSRKATAKQQSNGGRKSAKPKKKAAASSSRSSSRSSSGGGSSRSRAKKPASRSSSGGSKRGGSRAKASSSSSKRSK